MRIAIDVTIQCLATRTGVQRAQRGLLGAFAEIGIPHELVLVSRQAVPAAADLPASFSRHVIAARRPGPLWREMSLLRFLDRQGFDLYHSPVSAIPLGGSVPRIATVHEVPWVTGAPRYDRGRGINHRLALAHAARRAAAIIVPSRATADAVVKRHPVAEGKTRVVPHGIDAIFFEPAATTRSGLLAKLKIPDGPYVLTVGAERAKKNHALVTRALDHAGLEDLQWIAAGAGSPTRKTEHERRIGARTVSDDTLRDLYANAEALIMPSLSEGFGLPPLEAMAAGCPAIVSDRASLPEIAGDAALIIDPTDPGSLGAALLRLRQDTPLRESLKAAGLARARSFRWRRAAEAVLETYDAIGGTK
ncbi:MAG: glycosyltransferase family 1 protein [Planctomycetota bacterium]